MRKDYKVSFRREASVREVAENFRKRLGLGDAPGFNVATCVLRLHDEELLTSGKLELDFYNQRPDEPFAFVTFLPKRTLHVDRQLWAEAREYNEPELRYILAHEIGHLVLHSHYTQGFSGDKSNAWLEEELSEWQADRFADYSLVSDAEVKRYGSPSMIANYCAVTREVALRRLGPNFNFLGDPCPECGNFTMARIRGCLKCDTCGPRAICD